MEEERERAKSAQEEQDVEAHRTKAARDESEGSSDPGRKATDEEESDVEAHRFKA